MTGFTMPAGWERHRQCPASLTREGAREYMRLAKLLRGLDAVLAAEITAVCRLAEDFARGAGAGRRGSPIRGPIPRTLRFRPGGPAARFEKQVAARTAADLDRVYDGVPPDVLRPVRRCQEQRSGAVAHRRGYALGTVLEPRGQDVRAARRAHELRETVLDYAAPRDADGRLVFGSEPDAADLSAALEGAAAKRLRLDGPNVAARGRRQSTRHEPEPASASCYVQEAPSGTRSCAAALREYERDLARDQRAKTALLAMMDDLPGELGALMREQYAELTAAA